MPDILPPEFRLRLEQIVPPDWLAGVLDSFRVTKSTSFRVNRIKSTPEAILAALRDHSIAANPCDWSPNAFQVPPAHRESLTHSQLVADGRMYIQGLSSILASLILDPQPGEEVLDLAAAPGGKATHIAALMRNQGRLAVVEPIRKRMYRLADNLKKMGVQIAKTYLSDGRKVGQKVPERFDRVMLDAPCSGEARLHASRPEASSFWSLRKIREQSRKQAGLIRSAFQSLKPGGLLLYATCSFAPEENEAIVSQLLEESGPQAELLDLKLPIAHIQSGLTSFGNANFAPSLSRARRILPNAHYDGFFMAKIRKHPL